MPKNSLFNKIFQLPVYIHLLAILAIACITGYIVLKTIDTYTNHNQAVTVPDVRGLQIEEAIPFLEKNLLSHSIYDSIYSKDVPPGAIVDLLPEANSKVKKKRTIYITVNAKTEETAVIPEIEDMSLSFRQAYAILKARGFMDLEYKYVTGEFLDLALGVEYGGQMVKKGARVPLSAKLILVVSDGNSTIIQTDSTKEENSETFIGDESWF
jgi:Uncharacterized protein conserved in bacteria